MEQQSTLRLVALVSYGTQFLQGRMSLDDWYRHGIFFKARMLFREREGHALLADDFTLWLAVLQKTGARRLTLHRAADVVANAALAEDTAYAIVVHYSASHQIWTLEEEKAAWRAHPAVEPGPNGPWPVYPDAAYYGGEIDTVCFVEERAGACLIRATDWKTLAKEISRDLDISVPSSTVKPGPFVAHVGGAPDWAEMPLFPQGGVRATAHRMVATLQDQQSTFANDTHPKNDSSHFQFMDQESADRMMAWGQRLDAWLVDVLIRCANEDS